MLAFAQHILSLFFILFIFPFRAFAAPAFSNISARINTPTVTEILAAHNSIRAQHDALPLTWSDELALRATLWANRCIFENTGGVLRSQPYGENIAAATGVFTPEDVVALFTADSAEYDPANPTYNHFTQVVWKRTTRLGCAIATCVGLFPPRPDPATLYVCLYDPPGNVVGRASINVVI